MSNKRRSFSPEFKLQCVIDVLSGQRRPAQICREHNISDSLLTRWRRQFAEEAPKVFARKRELMNMADHEFSVSMLCDVIAVGEFCRQGVENRMRKKHSSD